MKTPIKKIVTKGSTASVPYSQYIGAPEDITVDPIGKTINFHDGVTTGGISLSGSGGGVSSIGLTSNSNTLIIIGNVITTSGTFDLKLANSGVTPGSYTNSSIVVDSYGRISSASNGSNIALSNGVVTPVTTIVSSGSTQALIFPSAANAAYDITLTANCTVTLSGGTTGQYQIVTLIARAGNGGYSLNLPTNIRWSGGVSPTPSNVANTINVFTFSTSDGGTTIFGGY